MFRFISKSEREVAPFIYGVGKIAFSFIGLLQEEMGRQGIRVQFLDAVETGNRHVVLLRKEERRDREGNEDWGKRVQVGSGMHCGDGFIVASGLRQEVAVPKVDIRGARREGKSVFEILVGAFKVPVMDIFDPSEGVVGLAEMGVDLEGVKSGGLGFGEPFLRRNELTGGGPAIGFCQFGIGWSVGGIGVDGLVEVANGFFQAIGTETVGEVFAFEEGFVGFGDDSMADREPSLLL